MRGRGWGWGGGTFSLSVIRSLLQGGREKCEKLICPNAKLIDSRRTTKVESSTDMMRLGTGNRNVKKMMSANSKSSSSEIIN